MVITLASHVISFHKSFHPPGKCNQFTFQIQQYPKTNNITFIPPNCINACAIFAIKPYTKNKPTSYIHEHWVLAAATKEVPNVQEFNQWSQDWTNDYILFTFLQPFTIITNTGPTVLMPGHVVHTSFSSKSRQLSAI